MPARAAASASAAVVVVLPTPPLPATMTTRDVEQNRVSSIQPHGTGARPTGRRSVPTRVLCVLVVAGALWIAGAWPGSPAGAADTGRQGIDVVQVNGPLDPPNVSLVRSVIREANRKGSTLVVIQLDSPGVVDSDVAPLVRPRATSAGAVARLLTNLASGTERNPSGITNALRRRLSSAEAKRVGAV